MKILLIRFSSIGDIILTEPISYILHKNFPEAQIDYLTKRGFIPLVESFRYIDNIFPDDDNAIFNKEYDLILDLHSKLKSFIYSHKIKAYKKLHYNKKHLQRLLIVKKLSKSHISSTLDLYLGVLKKLSVHFETVKPVLEYETQQKIKNYLDHIKKDKKIVVIFPGAKHQTKMYPLEYLIQFIRLNKAKYTFILAGSKDEKELCDKIVRESGIIHDLSSKLNLKELIYLISQVDLVISNDSGPMHIAAALSKPQIAIFGSTHPSLGFVPLNDKAIILQKELPCRPCHLHGRDFCPLKHFRCMKDISPYELSDALKMLQKRYF